MPKQHTKSGVFLFQTGSSAITSRRPTMLAARCSVASCTLADLPGDDPLHGGVAGFFGDTLLFQKIVLREKLPPSTF